MSIVLRCSMEGGGMMTTVVVTRSERDRRSVKIKLSERVLDLCRQLVEMEARHAKSLTDLGWPHPAPGPRPKHRWRRRRDLRQ